MRKMGGKKQREMEEQEEASETGREENFSMMKQSLLLGDWTRLPPMGGPAPWQQALSPREKQPYPSTPPYFSLLFSLTTPLLPPITRPGVFIAG